MSIPVISARHDAVDCFTSPDNISTAEAIQNHLKGLRNVPRILMLLKSGKAGIRDWEGIVKVTSHRGYVGRRIDVFLSLLSTPRSSGRR